MIRLMAFPNQVQFSRVLSRLLSIFRLCKYESFGKSTYPHLVAGLRLSLFYRANHILCLRQILQIGEWRPSNKKRCQLHSDIILVTGTGMVSGRIPLGIWSL